VKSLETVNKRQKMSVLIEDFKKEHSEIVDTLKEVKELGIFTKEGQAKLMSVKATNKEDEKFYPVLWKEAVQNKKLKEELEEFAKDLEDFSRFVFGFFDKYDKGIIGTSLFLDFETLFMVLHTRIKNEENILYGEYEKID
jgi:hypothetical protein